MNFSRSPKRLAWYSGLSARADSSALFSPPPASASSIGNQSCCHVRCQSVILKLDGRMNAAGSISLGTGSRIPCHVTRLYDASAPMGPNEISSVCSSSPSSMPTALCWPLETSILAATYKWPKWRGATPQMLEKRPLLRPEVAVLARSALRADTGSTCEVGTWPTASASHPSPCSLSLHELSVLSGHMHIHRKLGWQYTKKRAGAALR